jgi:hypothetical protein
LGVRGDRGEIGGAFGLEEEVEAGDLLGEDVDLFGLLLKHLAEIVDVAGGVGGLLREEHGRAAKKECEGADKAWHQGK